MQQYMENARTFFKEFSIIAMEYSKVFVNAVNSRVAVIKNEQSDFLISQYNTLRAQLMLYSIVTNVTTFFAILWSFRHGLCSIFSASGAYSSSWFDYWVTGLIMTVLFSYSAIVTKSLHTNDYRLIKQVHRPGVMLGAICFPALIFLIYAFSMKFYEKLVLVLVVLQFIVYSWQVIMVFDLQTMIFARL